MVQAKIKNDFDTREVVLAAVKELYAAGRVATRTTIVELTGLKQSIVDDSLKVLNDDMLIRRIERGCYMPVIKLPPARPIYLTVIDEHWAKLEIGDDCAIPILISEVQRIGMLTGGFVIRAHAAMIHDQVNTLVNEQHNRINALGREVTKLDRRQKRQGE